MATKKATKKRMPAAARRQLILESAMQLFAKKGFHGTTTADLARTAGVSEALIFRFFPDKESLYREVQFLCVEARGAADSMLDQARPGTENLVRAVLILIYEVFSGFGGRTKNETLRRLQTHSMLEDGKFARAFFKSHFKVYFPFIDRCLKSAHRSGDLEPGGMPLECVIWFTHHLPMMVRISILSHRADYFASSDAELLESMALFCLRGIGLKSSAIKKNLPRNWTEQFNLLKG